MGDAMNNTTGASDAGERDLSGSTGGEDLGIDNGGLGSTDTGTSGLGIVGIGAGIGELGSARQLSGVSGEQRVDVFQGYDDGHFTSFTAR
ncbi:unnamed protein product [Ilex paraguariensis]|uniref:Uncharacterized protein n=1 Tax=Ilex paraguariensis TaxID=185542 RepID=A0ABC8RLZ2_9AQUA